MTSMRLSEQELVQDVLEMLPVFSARLYGLRSHQNKALVEELDKSAKKISKIYGIDLEYSCIIPISLRKQGGDLACPS